MVNVFQHDSSNAYFVEDSTCSEKNITILAHAGKS